MADDGAALKGLRLLTLARGREGYGFHMYTNKSLRGQYIKWVSPNGPADLAGMLPGDHVLQVDGLDVETETHQKVVEIIRTGSGKEKKILVIDQETERDIRSQGGDIVASDATVMIPRTVESTSDYPSVSAPTRSSRKSMGSDEPDGPSLTPVKPKHGTMPGAGQGLGGAVGTSYAGTTQNIGKKSERVRVKQKRDWRSSIEAYNNL